MELRGRRLLKSHERSAEMVISWPYPPLPPLTQNITALATCSPNSLDASERYYCCGDLIVARALPECTRRTLLVRSRNILLRCRTVSGALPRSRKSAARRSSALGELLPFLVDDALHLLLRL